MAYAGSTRRVFPLQIQTSDAPLPSAAQRSLLPPKSPLHGARTSAPMGTVTGMGGFERMLLLRNMNLSVPLAGTAADGTSVVTSKASSITAPTTASSDDVSAAHNLRERKLAETRRRVEVQLMTREDYTDTPEGDARRQRQDERACMREEELLTQRVVQHEKAQRRAAQLQQQADDEARIKEMFLAKRRDEMAQQAQAAHEKEAERKRVLDAKMRALKDEADRKAQHEYAARQKKLADEVQAERDVRTAAIELVLMHVEDEYASAMRVEWLAEQERLRQIEAEALEWQRFEEREAQRQREETQRRRDAQKEQYEQDRMRRMQIHKLQQDRVRTAAADKRRREQDQQGDGVATAAADATLQRLRSQCEPTTDVPSIRLAPPGSPSASSELPLSIVTTARNVQPTARRPPPPQEMAVTLNAIVEQAPVPPPPVLSPAECVEPSTTVADGTIKNDDATGERIPEVFAISTTVSETAQGSEASVIEIDKCDEPTAASSDDVTHGDEAVNNESALATVSSTTDSPNDAVSDENPNVSPDTVMEEPPPCELTTQLPSPVLAVVVEVAPDEPIVIQPEVLSLEILRQEGVTPVAEVLSVTAGSPSSIAGLVPRDLLIEFGGITSATPKCIVAIAECVQQHVNQRIALVVLRPVEREQSDRVGEDDTVVQRCELGLVPRKWKGKGLLGCQLSPFKWPTATVTSSNADVPLSDSSDNASSGYDALVLHQVAVGSLAHRIGLLDGDVLARCGTLDVARASTTNPSDALAAVATQLQTEWRDAQRELPLVLQRWDDDAQSYAVVHVVLPVVATPIEPLGCALTTYAQYYYPASSSVSILQQGCVACDECYYTSLPSSLHAAALSGHVACLDALLATCSSDFFDWRDDEGRSPLFYACYARQADTARSLVTHLLVSTGPYDPVSGADAYGDSPLHAAAASDCVDAIVCLLETHFITDVNLANTLTQATAAHVAASQSALHVLHTQFHADVLALDADGRMPLFYACLRNDPTSVAFLCALHPDFADYADSAGGNTPLHMAAWCGFTDVVRALVPWLPNIALFVPNQDGLDARALAQQSGWHDLANDLERLMTPP